MEHPVRVAEARLALAYRILGGQHVGDVDADAEEPNRAAFCIALDFTPQIDAALFATREHGAMDEIVEATRLPGAGNGRVDGGEVFGVQ